MLINLNNCKELLGVNAGSFYKELRYGSYKYSRVLSCLGDTLHPPGVPVEVVIDAFCYRLYSSKTVLTQHYDIWKDVIYRALKLTDSKGVSKFYKKDLNNTVWGFIPSKCIKKDTIGSFVLPTDIILSIDSYILGKGYGYEEGIQVLIELRDHMLCLDNITFVPGMVTNNDEGIIPHVIKALKQPKDIDISIFKEAIDFLGEGDEFLLEIISEYEGTIDISPDTLKMLKTEYMGSTIKKALDAL